MWVWEKLKDAGGVAVGLLELVGLRYSVEHYEAKVSEVLWRGSRLNPEDYADLKSRGFKTIISFCAENDGDAKAAEAVGLAHIRIPLIDNTLPTREEVLRFIDLVTNKDSGICYCHCEAGTGRTGLFCACYRISKMGWTPEQALAEYRDFAKKEGRSTLEDQEKFVLNWA
jgi:protein tyrosine/serine phosphatase